MTRSGLIRAALLCALAVFAAGEAAAQIGGGMPGGSPGGGMGRRGGMRGDSNRTQRPAQSETRQDVFQTTLEELRIDLKLDAAQQAAWNAYAEKLGALMSDLARERSRSLPSVTQVSQTAPQQLDRIVMLAQNRATAIEEAASAAKSLYAMLSAEQKSVADARLPGIVSLALSQSGTAAPPGRAAR